MTILLIRHGETESNATRVVQTPETPLNLRGRGQAKLLARRLGAEPIARILSSHLRRAMETAEPLAARTGLGIDQDPDLAERNFGLHRGKPYAALGIDIMSLDHVPPQGESWEEFHRRVGRVWSRVTETAKALDGNLAVLTHGLVCYSMALHHLTLAPREEPPTRWGNTSLTVIEGGPPWRAVLLNCTSHLEGEYIDQTGSASGM